MTNIKSILYTIGTLVLLITGILILPVGALLLTIAIIYSFYRIIFYVKLYFMWETMINLQKALLIVSQLLNDYLNDPNISVTKEQEQAVLLIRDIAEGNGWSVQNEFRD